MEPLDERLAKVLPAHFKAEALVVRKNIHMTVRKLPGDPKKLRGRVVVAPAAGWVTVTSKNLTRVDASAAPADDREDWEYDPRDSYDHYLTRAERCAWPAAKQRAKVAKLLEKEFPTVKLPAAARTSWSAEYRLAMEGVEREALRAVERDNREWCKAWDEDRFRGAFLRPTTAGGPCGADAAPPYQPTNRMAAHLAKCKPPILLAAHLQSDDDKTEYESSTDDGEWQPEYDTRLETPDALYPGRFELHVLPALGGERLSQRGGAAWHVLVHGRVRWCLLPPNGGRYVKRRYHELQRAPPKPAASCRHQDFVSGLDWFRSEFETLADPAARVPLSEIVQEAGEALWVPEGWSAARLALKPSVGFALDVGSLNAPGPRGNPPGIMDDDRPARPSIFTKHTDPEYLESDYSWIPDDAFLKQLEGLNTNLKKAMDEAAEKAAAKWAEQKFESGEWIRPENIAAAAAAVRQVDEPPPPPPDSIAAAEPSEMLKRWAASPFHPDQNPSYLRQPEEG
ncbi:protein-disulfide reductase [Aureococcus anophagefferens]|nr:protein-disulfide reductase [Aureococcus anophagefferens]